MPIFKGLLLALAFCGLTANAETIASAQPTNPKVVVHTSRGNFTIELYPQKAPITVANFLDYVNSGFYEGVIFHRVISNKVIQTGGHTEDLAEKPTKAPIINESNNQLHNERWTVAMARQQDPDSATSQFFINMKLNTDFDYRPEKHGYAVFGKVIDGQHVVRAISLVPTQTKYIFDDIPVNNIVIKRIEVQ